MFVFNIVSAVNWRPNQRIHALGVKFKIWKHFHPPPSIVSTYIDRELLAAVAVALPATNQT